MWAISRPTIAASEVYGTCISRVTGWRRELLDGFAESVAEAAAHFSEAAERLAFYELHSAGIQPKAPETRKELIKVYTDRMAKEGAPGREIYERLKLAVPRCPLCGHRDVKTLDHYLPKTKYPLLAVAPDNLIPACAECNTAKRNATPETEEVQTLHPYYDDLGSGQWLHAEVIQGTPPALRFFILPSQSWSPMQAKRVHHHFEAFDLGGLYALQAGDELAGIEFSLRGQLSAGGVDAVRSFLEDLAVSRERFRPNHWMSATYRAISSNAWYCSGGFRFS